MSTAQIVRTTLAPLAQAPVPDDEAASLFDSGVIDSFALMDVIASLEDAFGVKVPDGDLTPRKFETIAKISAYFDARRAS